MPGGGEGEQRDDVHPDIRAKEPIADIPIEGQDREQNKRADKFFFSSTRTTTTAPSILMIPLSGFDTLPTRFIV